MPSLLARWDLPAGRNTSLPRKITKGAESYRQLELFEGVHHPRPRPIPDIDVKSAGSCPRARMTFARSFSTAKGFAWANLEKCFRGSKRRNSSKRSGSENVANLSVRKRPAHDAGRSSRCVAGEIPIAYFSQGGWFYGVTTTRREEYLSPAEQFHLADKPSFCLDLSRALVAGKIRKPANHAPAETREPPATQLNHSSARSTTRNVRSRWTNCSHRRKRRPRIFRTLCRHDQSGQRGRRNSPSGDNALAMATLVNSPTLVSRKLLRNLVAMRRWPRREVLPKTKSAEPAANAASRST